MRRIRIYKKKKRNIERLHLEELRETPNIKYLTIQESI